MIREIISEELKKAIGEEVSYTVEPQETAEFGEYSSNAALILAKQSGKNPRELAAGLQEKLSASPELGGVVERIEVAGAGFLNFYLQRGVFAENIKTALSRKKNFGKNDALHGKKIIVEYTDPNPFKEFHIGHMMTNTIGESLSRVFEFAGAEVKRANYQGDAGLHVAKAIWHFFRRGGGDVLPLASGEDYVQGNIAYDEDLNAKEGIEAVNKKIYGRSDPAINKAYDEGRQKSLEAFEGIYTTLGTKFDFYFFESEVGELGQEAVREGLKKGIFERSDGATVFRGEKYGLHTRVFINSQGLPTYEAKELGLAKEKYAQYPYDCSFVVTANEIIDYFRVLLKAMELLYPDLAQKTSHVPHGILRTSKGKMSSRTGKIISFKALLGEVMEKILPKMGEVERKNEVAAQVSVGALKHSILKQAIRKDVVFDFNTSLSFEGDSGPYLQYTYARCRSVLRKAEEKSLKPSAAEAPANVDEAERTLLWFPEAVARAVREHEPHHVAVYLGKLAKAFNNFYARKKIIDSGEARGYRLALTEAVSIAIKNGLWLLGIEAPEEM